MSDDIDVLVLYVTHADIKKLVRHCIEQCRGWNLSLNKLVPKVKRCLDSYGVVVSERYISDVVKELRGR